MGVVCKHKSDEMIHQTYRTDFPNQVHQMNISISKNHFLLKNGDIKYQYKKFNINWKNHQKTGKNHLVNYLIRDHYSGCYYAEIHDINEMPKLSDFLFNAWKRKSTFAFEGIPKYLILGKDVIQKFPEIQTFESNLDSFNLQTAKNGFDTGIRSVRDWESNLRYYLSYDNINNLRDFNNNSFEICREINELLNSKKRVSNLEKWKNNNPYIFMYNEKEKFIEFFKKKAVTQHAV